MRNIDHYYTEPCADPEGGGGAGGTDASGKSQVTIGFLVWIFAGGPMVARFVHKVNDLKKMSKLCNNLPPTPLRNFLDPPISTLEPSGCEVK